MWTYPEEFDVIVVGAGHAGCEAAHAAARMGAKTLLLTMTLDTIAKMSCNPAVGGTAKGHMVREIDALGGVMGKVTDETAIQFRMLNASKGPAVWSPRAQADKFAYQTAMKKRLEMIPGLFIKQGTTENLIVEEQKVVGVETIEGISYRGKTVVLSAGTFMKGLIHIGETQFPGGRAGDKPSVGLSASLEKLGFRLGRLKTGTPPRINKRSIDFSVMEEQYGDLNVRFSFDPPETLGLPQVPCHIVYTNEATRQVILKNLHRSPMYSGKIKSVGPRYCPSIEDKIVRFADKDRHQLFLEPEGLSTNEIYVNGISTSLPFDVQLEMIKTVPGMERAEIMRPAYAIEYDYVKSGQLGLTLETNSIENLFLAGQINGTTGYEEAAGQGLVAGINAACKILSKEPLILNRAESYIGVMIDELISKDLEEPYRMFTSRAEHRLLLRQDNADIRLRHHGYRLGLINQSQYDVLLSKKEKIEQEIERLQKTFCQVNGKSVSFAQYLCRPETSYQQLLIDYSKIVVDHGEEINRQIELQLKYSGYIGRQKNEADKVIAMERLIIPEDFNFRDVKGLSNEAREKLHKIRPINIGQASRLSGVSHADVSILLVAVRSSGSIERRTKELN